MSNCPCCSNVMLRHIRKAQVYWFCRSCWQEMPLTDLTPTSHQSELGLVDRRLHHQRHLITTR